MTRPKASQNASSARKKEKLALLLGQGRLKERLPVAVVDIGSNSVRQVIYEGLTRAPAVIFNEKILCGLGEGLVATGKLNEKAVIRTLNALRRFVALQKQAHVDKVHIIATAAARDAKNGQAFIDKVEKIAGHKVEVLTGAMEAHYSAFGILSGFHKPSGIVGDLGGGSLELVGLNGGAKKGITLPLGGLRLRELSDGSLEKAQEIVVKHLKKNEIEWPSKQRTLYAVGGTWRSLSKLHIANQKYPLRSVHDYELEAQEMARFCDQVISGELKNIKGLGAVSKNRRDLLPFGAVVLKEIINLYKPEKLAISSLGVREGLLYSRLKKKEREKDSLLVAAKDFSILRSRSPEHCEELSNWTAKAFKLLEIKESENEERYRVASCYLADIGWRAHPDFRAQQALEVIASAGFVGIDHEGRAYLAISNYHRYMGLSAKVKTPIIAELASLDVQKKARLLAAIFRVLYLFSASTPGVIPQLNMVREGDQFTITVPKKISDLCGERPTERVKHLTKELGMDVKLKVV